MWFYRSSTICYTALNRQRNLLTLRFLRFELRTEKIRQLSETPRWAISQKSLPLQALICLNFSWNPEELNEKKVNHYKQTYVIIITHSPAIAFYPHPTHIMTTVRWTTFMCYNTLKIEQSSKNIILSQKIDQQKKTAQSAPLRRKSLIARPVQLINPIPY